METMDNGSIDHGVIIFLVSSLRSYSVLVQTTKASQTIKELEPPFDRRTYGIFLLSFPKAICSLFKYKKLIYIVYRDV